MTNNRSAVAFWVAQYNAAVALLATRTSERDSARNSLYVSGVWGSGQTWQAQDATDLANYNAEVALYNNEVAAYNAALSPAAVDHLFAQGTAAGDGATHSNVANVTADRTGQWLVIWRATNSNTGLQQFQVFGYVAGVQQASVVAASLNAGLGGAIGGVWQGSAAAGTVFRTDVAGNGSGTITGFVDAYFIPTQGNPH